MDLQRDGVWDRPSEFEDDPYPITAKLIEESKAHELLDGPPVWVDGPITILHGTKDEVVPLSHAQAVANWVQGDPVTLTTIEGGDHRLSTAPDLDRLWQAIEGSGDFPDTARVKFVMLRTVSNQNGVPNPAKIPVKKQPRK